MTEKDCGLGDARSTRTLIYADPPYIGQSKRHYGDHEDYAGEVDHVDLLRQLDAADGFVLHLSSPSVPAIGHIMTEYGYCLDARWMSWVKPFAAFKRNIPVAYAWEPVLVRPVRKPVVNGRVVMRDWCSESITMQRGLSGAKPEQVCRWLFEVAGTEPTDEMIDLYPGSGAVTRAWERWKADALDPGTAPSPVQNRLGKLPKWAQEHIGALEMELESKAHFVDRGPHSRACGWRYHPHGSACSTNCPTCGGQPLTTPENVEEP